MPCDIPQTIHLHFNKIFFSLSKFILVNPGNYWGEEWTTCADISWGWKSLKIHASHTFWRILGGHHTVWHAGDRNPSQLHLVALPRWKEGTFHCILNVLSHQRISTCNVRYSVCHTLLLNCTFSFLSAGCKSKYILKQLGKQWWNRSWVSESQRPTARCSSLISQAWKIFGSFFCKHGKYYLQYEIVGKIDGEHVLKYLM